MNIRTEIKIGVAALILVIVIAFSERKQNAVAVSDVVVKIENTHNNHFVDESDILKLMDLDRENIQGASVDKINLREIEKRIETNRFIESAELYSDLKGNLIVKATLRRPIARIVRNDGPDGYIAEDGTVMPVSDKFTTRVILISGAIVPTLLKIENVTKDELGQQLMDMIRFIREDSFWNAQVAQIDINQKWKITMVPQIGDETIEFGTPENFEAKFRKLKIFYKEILPTKGWNKYDRVNLEYEGQIIAE